ncbi:MAG: hypothetical protein ACFE94_10255 [Candidatus Hodarchaeota archaeon]
MTEEILKFTRLTFIIHFVIGVIFTIAFWMPEMTADIYGIAYTDETGAMSLIIGSVFAALTVSSLFGFLAKEWKEVKIVVIAEIMWLVAGIVTHIMNFSIYEVGMAVLTLIIMIIILLLFLLTFLQQQDILKSLWK